MKPTHTGMKLKVLALSPMLALALAGSTPAHAQSLTNVTYVGGTVLPGHGLHGRVLIGTSDTLQFEGTSTLEIPYARVRSYESTSHKIVHVGLITEAVWRLLAPWPEGKQLSISYTDDADHAQVVVLEMSRADEALLVDVLKTRVPRGADRQPMPRPVATAAGVAASH